MPPASRHAPQRCPPPKSRARRRDRCRGKNGERHRPERRTELVGENRGGRWSAAGLADPYAKARQRQLQTIVSQGAQRRHGRPRCERHGEDLALVCAVRERRDRDAHGHLEHRQRTSGEEGDARIAQAQLRGSARRASRSRNGDVERVDDRQHREHVPAVAWCSRGRGAGRRARRCAQGLQVHPCALARQPPPPAPVQARPRTVRPLAAQVATPSRSARTPFTHTSSTPVAS